MKKILLSMAMAIATLVSPTMVCANPVAASEQTSVAVQQAQSAGDVIIIIIETPDELIIIVAAP